MILFLSQVRFLMLFLVIGMTPAVIGSEPATQTASADNSAGDKARPQACAEGKALGPVRIQVGAVEALVYVGKKVTLPVLVKGVCDLAGFSFWMNYDRRLVQLVEVGETPFLAGSPPVELEFTGLQPGVPRQTIEGVRPPGSGGVDGRGILARLVFRGLAQGQTSINLLRLHLFDPQGVELPSFQVPVRITVLPVSVQPGDPRDARRSGGQRP